MPRTTRLCHALPRLLDNSQDQGGFNARFPCPPHAPHSHIQRRERGGGAKLCQTRTPHILHACHTPTQEHGGKACLPRFLTPPRLPTPSNQVNVLKLTNNMCPRLLHALPGLINPSQDQGGVKACFSRFSPPSTPSHAP